MRNQQSQLKITAFDDYFGFRALINDVSIWVLPDISDELVYAADAVILSPWPRND